MRVFIVHGWGGNPSSDWYPWLKENLEKNGLEIVIPQMPDTEAPSINAWVSNLRRIVGKPDRKTYFVGHSIGCQAIMRYLATLPKAVAIGGIIFVAGWLALRNLEDDEARLVARPWLETPIEFAKVNEKTRHIFLFLSDNDPYVDYKENTALFQKNLKVKVVIEKGKGHFTASDGVTTVPEVMDKLIGIAK